MKNGVTIRDIAKQAGVSIGTASNVLSGKPGPAPPTRDRVLKAAADLHFTPNALIRSLQTGKTSTIGLFTWRIAAEGESSITARILHGVSSALDEMGYDLLLYGRHPHEGEVPAGFFLDGRIDGLITAPGGPNEAALEALAAHKLPTIALYQSPDIPGIGTVNIDNVGGVLATVEHLVERGHHRIGFIAPSYTYDYQQRVAGYKAGLAENGIPQDLHLVLDWTGAATDAVPQIVDRMSVSREPMTALIAGDDNIALAILTELRRQGIHPPDRLSLAGFDDLVTACASQGLTTVRQPAASVGRTAVALLRDLIDGAPASNCHITLPVERVIRTTTAAPSLSGASAKVIAR